MGDYEVTLKDEDGEELFTEIFDITGLSIAELREKIIEKYVDHLVNAACRVEIAKVGDLRLKKRN